MPSAGLNSDAAGRLERLQTGTGAFADFEYDGRSFLSQSSGSVDDLFLDGFETGDFRCWDSVVGGSSGTPGPGCTPVVSPPSTTAVYDSNGLFYSRTTDDGQGAISLLSH